MGISYSVDTEDAAAVAMVRERPMSFKDSVEVCRHVKGLPVEDALAALERVIDGDEPVPMKQHNSGVGHRGDLEGWDAGRFPEKATQGIVDALENAVANAEHQGHDTDELAVDHIAAHKVGESQGRKPRAMGRATAWNTPLVDVEVVLSPPETEAEPEEDAGDEETTERGPEATEEPEPEPEETGADEDDDEPAEDDETDDAEAEEADEAPSDAPGSIEDVEGVGPAKADALRDAGYDDVDALREATEDELADVEGVGPALAARIKADVGGLDVEDGGDE